MTPQDLDLIRIDADSVVANADEFASMFYATLFDLDPSARGLFPDDMAEQRRKLMSELSALIGLGLAATSDGLDGLERRGGELGRRHQGYGVTAEHYDTVGIALLAALRRQVADWDDEHEQAWTRLYTLVASVMQGPARAEVS